MTNMMASTPTMKMARSRKFARLGRNTKAASRESAKPDADPSYVRCIAALEWSNTSLKPFEHSEDPSLVGSLSHRQYSTADRIPPK